MAAALAAAARRAAAEDAEAALADKAATTTAAPADGAPADATAPTDDTAAAADSDAGPAVPSPPKSAAGALARARTKMRMAGIMDSSLADSRKAAEDAAAAASAVGVRKNRTLSMRNAANPKETERIARERAERLFGDRPAVSFAAAVGVSARAGARRSPSPAPFQPGPARPSLQDNFNSGMHNGGSMSPSRCRGSPRRVGRAALARTEVRARPAGTGPRRATARPAVLPAGASGAGAFAVGLCA